MVAMFSESPLLTVLLGRNLEEVLLIAVLGQQPVDDDLLGLANPVAAGHCLQVILGTAERGAGDTQGKPMSPDVAHRGACIC